MKKLTLTKLIVLLLFTFSYSQQERIISYNSDIVVKQNRSLDITEYITVYASGNEIKRGIKIAYPTTRILGDHGKVNVRYNIKDIRKDGIEEPYHTEKNGNRLIIYFGDKDVFLEPGIYEYKINYTVKNQIAFFDKYDEFYWNPIGSYSSFPIGSANVNVTFPQGVNVVQEEAYVGGYGKMDKSYTISQNDNVLQYAITRPLNPQEGYTIAIGVEKGLFEEPNIFEMYSLLFAFFISILTLFGYFLYTWIRYGIDPQAPPSYPVYSPPNDLSPAAMSYILKEGNSTNAITASMIALVNGQYISIEKLDRTGFFKSQDKYEIRNLKKDLTGLPEEQRYIIESLFSSSDSIILDGEYDSKVSTMNSRHRKSIIEDHKAFVTEGNNTKKLIFPFLFIIFATVVMAILYFRTSYSVGIHPALIFVFPIIGVILTAVYGYFIKKPTVEKLELQSRIKGFKQYLSMTEKDRMNVLNPPEKTIGHFEAMLPFAFALGVDHNWTSLFQQILSEASYYDKNPQYGFYQDGNFGRSFSRTVSSGSTQPSSSSGSGGGGFSGGGGGGGSVGGW